VGETVGDNLNLQSYLLNLHYKQSISLLLPLQSGFDEFGSLIATETSLEKVRRANHLVFFGGGNGS